MRAAAGKGSGEREMDRAGVGGGARTLEAPRGRSGGQMDKVRKPQGQALAALTSCPSVVSLGRTGQAPTQGPQRQSHVGERSWGQRHRPFLLLH